MSKKLLSIILSAALTAVFLFPSAAAAAEKSYVFKCGLTGNEDHQLAVGMRILKDLVEKKTNGRIKIELFLNSALGAEREIAESVIMGSSQVTSITLDGALPAWVHDGAIMSIPYLFDTRAQAYNTLDTLLFKHLTPFFEKNNLKLFGFTELGFRHFSNNKRPVKVPADMQGMIIRVQEAPVWFALCEAVNATPTPMAISELYSALQQGVIDGQENPLGTFVTTKFYEVQKYLTLDGHTYCPGVVVMNLDVYNSLSDADQKLFNDCVQEMIPQQRKIMADNDTKYLNELKGISRLTIEEHPDIAAFRAATKDIGDQPNIKALFDTPDLIQKVRDHVASLPK